MQKGIYMCGFCFYRGVTVKASGDTSVMHGEILSLFCWNRDRVTVCGFKNAIIKL